MLIPHHNRVGSLERALDALATQTLVPAVCVIDNASTDATPALLASRPEVRWVRLDRNVGFGAAINEGARSSDADLLVCLNNDAVADRHLIERVVAAQESTSAEMVAGCLRSPDGRVESLGVEVDTALNAYDAGNGSAYPPESAVEPLGPCGGSGAYLREALLAVGGFDEAIFAYLEDVDLAIRMRLAGMRCAAAPDAFAWHEHSATLGGGSAAKNELLGFARGYLLWKYGSGLSLGARTWGLASDAIVYTGKALIDGNVAAIRGRLRARRAFARRQRPPAAGRLAELVPLVRLGPIESLSRRLARRT